MPAPSDHTAPAVHALRVVELVADWHVTPQELLAGVGVTEDDLSAPGAQLSLATHCTIVERARTLTGEPGLGFHLGLRRRPSAYGYVGFAAVSSATIGDGLRLAVQFAPILSTALTLRLEVDRGVASLTIEEHVDLGKSRDVFLVAMLVGLWQMGCQTSGRDLGGALDLPIPQPAYYPRFAHLVPRMRFGCPVARIVFDAAGLDYPLVTADRVALRMTREQCERALEMIALDTRLVGRVRRIISDSDGPMRSIEDVSAALHVSPRTLKRKLAAQGVSFSALRERHQREKALLLLRSPALSLDEVADRVGYSAVQNFARAFRRWTGTTPAAFRKGTDRSAKTDRAPV